MSTHLHRVIVALDGSGLAESVLPYVEVRAPRLESRLALLRAVTALEGLIEAEAEVEVQGHVSSHAILTVVPITEDVRTLAVGYLRTIQARLQSKGIAVECEYPDDLAGPAIVQSARHLGAHLIAMTTHGRSGVSRGLRGSVADDVLHHAPCSLIG